MPMTDIHLRVSQDSGDLMAFDDSDDEITRCVIDQWIDNKSDNFYQEAACILRSEINRIKDVIENMSIMKPYSFILEDDDRNNISELYLVDDDIVIIGGDLMHDLDKDLDCFLNDLLIKKNEEIRLYIHLLLSLSFPLSTSAQRHEINDEKYPFIAGCC